jgi:DNA-binding LacI/PurR family transcriptional regulator
MCALPKHAVIFQKLHAALQRGDYASGERLPSEIVLARKWKASRPTVARALRDLQNIGLIDRHAGAGTFVRPPAVAVTGLLGLIADGLGATEILDPLATEIAQAGQVAGWTVLRGTAVADRQADEIAREWMQRGVAGVFFAPIEHHPVRAALNRAIVSRLEHHGMAVVLLDREIGEFPERSQLDLVSIDDFFAGFELAAHVLDQGARSLAFLARPAYPATTDLRLAGAQAAVRRVNGAKLNFCVGSPTDDAFVRRSRQRPICDAFICSNDSTAAELMQTLHAQNVGLPDDVLVAGFDDLRFAKLLTPSLTTMRQPCDQLGRVAIETMASRLRDRHAPARRVLVRAELVKRKSTTRLGPSMKG